MTFKIIMLKKVRVRGQHILRKGEILDADMGVDDDNQPIWMIHMGGMMSWLPVEDARVAEDAEVSAFEASCTVDLDAEALIRSVNPYANNPNFGRF